MRNEKYPGLQLRLFILREGLPVDVNMLLFAPERLRAPVDAGVEAAMGIKVDEESLGRQK